MDWLRNGNPQPGGNYAFPQQSSFSSPQSDSVPAFPAATSAHRSPTQLRSFLARYSDCSTPISQPSRAKSAPATPVNLDPTVPPSLNALSRPDPITTHPVTIGLKSCNAPLILTPPPSSDHGEDRELLLYEPTTDSPASITLPALPQPPNIPSPSAVQDLIETSYDNHTIYGVTSSMLMDWYTKHPSVIESDSIKYEYDESTERLIIKCSPSAVHDSLQIYFQARLSVVLPARIGSDKFMSSVQMSCGTGFCGFTGSLNMMTRKLPDASIQINGYDFPSVVCESGWSEKMEDLKSDAKLWLLQTEGQTVAVIVVAFNEEVFRDIDETDLVAGVTEDAAEGPDTADQEASQATTDPESSQDPDTPNEETLLLSRITNGNNPRALAAALLDLHRRQQLAKPLLGRIDATVHVFRANQSLTDIEESYTAVLLPAPAPADAQQQEFTLTMYDLLGELAEEEGIDDDEEVSFPLDILREIVRQQIPKMEVVRSLERAANVLKGLGMWQEMETYAQYKRNRKKRRIV